MHNPFSGHVGKEYRVRAFFGAGEATICCGDEEGRVWGWDLVDVRIVPNILFLVPRLYVLTRMFGVIGDCVTS